jgi:hypothetical protein
LCDEPGLGKTITCLALILRTKGLWTRLPNARQMGDCLAVAPTRLSPADVTSEAALKPVTINTAMCSNSSVIAVERDAHDLVLESLRGPSMTRRHDDQVEELPHPILISSLGSSPSPCPNRSPGREMLSALPRACTGASSVAYNLRSPGSRRREFPASALVS